MQKQLLKFFLLNNIYKDVFSSTSVKICSVIQLTRSLLLPIFLTALCVTQMDSQVNAPVLKCVDGDSLAWEIPLVECGDLQGYVIFRSNERAGPYEILDTVFSPLATGYDAPNPFGLPWFYFLSSLADCDEEEEVLFSDTISNQPMSTIPIISLSVEDGGVLINWAPSPEPHISRYVIYRNTPQGTIPIDTVQNVTEYLDENANAENRSEIYYVLGMDDCGTKSFFDQPHNSILLNFEVDSCTRTATFNWNEYINWPEGISRHVLWAEIDGDFRAVDTFSGSRLNGSYDQLIKDEPICFYIAAENDPLRAESRSNTICFTPNIVEPVRDLVVFNFCHDDLIREIDLSWYWNETAELEEYRILFRAGGSTQFTEVYREAIIADLTEINDFSIPIPAGQNPPFTVAIETTDLCGEVVRSNEKDVLFLEGRNLDENTNLLSWNFSLPESITNLQFNLEKIPLDGSIRTIDLSGQNENEYRDRLQGGELNDGRICYHINFNGQLLLPNGQIRSIACESNQVCITGEVRVFIPNAFRPGGVNSIFKPEFLFRDNIEDYRMIIFSRWGEKLFESRNPDIGWNGFVDGVIPDPGNFIYTIEFFSEDGSRFRESGDFLLLR